MYTFREATPRIQRIREKVRDRVIRGDAEKSVIQAEAIEKYKHIVPIIKRPLITKELCERMTLRVEDDDYFVGNKGKSFCGNSGIMWPLFVDIEREWAMKDDGLWHNPEGEELRLCIAQEDIDEMRRVAPVLFENSDWQVAEAWLPDGAEDFFALGACDYGERGRPGIMSLSCGHLTPGWHKIIKVGYGAIRRQAQDWMDAHEGNLMGDGMGRYMFYKSAVIACDGAEALTRRYAALCRERSAEAAEAGDGARRDELLRMAEGLDHIATEPAATFWEACQSVLIYQLAMSYETGFPAPAFGRFDQYTWPLLKGDLDAGRLTMEEAQELCDAFFLKSNCYYEGNIGRMTQTAGIGNTYQHTTVGGVLPETGEDATNPVTYMVLETIGRLRLHDPTVSMRVGPDTPDELWDCALATSRLVGGLPLFQNDDVIIPGLMQELGFELRDARDYSIIGCQEIVGSGTDYPAPNGVGAAHASVYYGVALAMAINNGINPMTGRQAKVQPGYLYEMQSIDEVRAAYEQMTDYLLKWYVTINNYAEYLVGYNMPYAMLSISMEGCMEKGLDAGSGGCKYNSYGGTATGLATIADSITTIKYLCFDKQTVTTRELYDAVMANWEGHEDLRQRILSEVPHYGNAEPYADEELKWAADLYYRQCSECSSQRSKVYKAGMYGAADHVLQGEYTPATPDGRKAGEPIADAISPAQSRDRGGPTSVFLSACCFDHAKYMDGMALNLRMHPSVVSNDEGVAKLREVTKAYFKSGGLECQYNIVDTDTLKKAQVRPEEFRDLVVRIAGYSAYFIELGEDLQNDIIARNENRI
ncbi:MAG: hypothetical protein LBD12_03310 [Clostridiales Family XIII bacterium]|jgi:formate C-acetyltransferase|nr:hypothetical protein [Clostridiales Family XIII bacterium]